MDSKSALAEAHLTTLDLLSGLFPLPGEFNLDPSTTAAMPSLRTLASSTTSPPSDLPSELRVLLVLSLAPESSTDSSLRLSLSLPLRPSLPRFTLHQPPWLSRAATQALSEELETYVLYAGGEGGGAAVVLDVVEWLRERGRDLQAIEARRVREEADKIEKLSKRVTGPLVRVWFWFPSLSTREKRDDMVKWAPQFQLTGFVLAGKPGILCVEGASMDVDAFMADIKSISWSDIPSFQKKVSERDRTPIQFRAFTQMEEITSLIEKGGARGNRGDMRQVRDWLERRGLGEAFGKVVGGGSFVS